MKIWFLTRSLYPHQKGGGGQIRLGQIKFLKELGYEINIVMPNYEKDKLNIINNIIQLPLSYNIRIASYLERVGFYEDYLDKWIKEAYKYLKNRVKKEDIVFATSGGELGMIKLGSLLKKEINCKFVINFHDPLAYSIVNGYKLNNKFHVSREKQEYRYIKNSDLIVTSSKSNQKSLINKYPFLKNKILNNYFGYIEKIKLEKYKKKNKKLKIAYIGNMGNLQKPEILYDIYKYLNSNHIEIYFIGNINPNRLLKSISEDNVFFLNFMPHVELLDFMIKNIDIGFVSLTSDYLGACVPSKIYEYINLGLPILGALPNGDGKDIINDNGYGIACNYNDINELSNALNSFLDINFLNDVKQNILKDRDKWFMKNKIKEIDTLLKKGKKV